MQTKNKTRSRGLLGSCGDGLFSSSIWAELFKHFSEATFWCLLHVANCVFAWWFTWMMGLQSLFCIGVWIQGTNFIVTDVAAKTIYHHIEILSQCKCKLKFTVKRGSVSNEVMGRSEVKLKKVASAMCGSASQLLSSVTIVCATSSERYCPR